MERKDILFDLKDGVYDLAINGGDFVVGKSDGQHINHILEATPGQFRQHPLLGCSIRKMINGQVDGKLTREVSMQLKADGYNIESISNNLITVNDKDFGESLTNGI